MPPKVKQPILPPQLLKEIGAQESKRRHGQAWVKPLSRRDLRKAERTQRKQKNVVSANLVKPSQPQAAGARRRTYPSKSSKPRLLLQRIAADPEDQFGYSDSESSNEGRDGTIDDEKEYQDTGSLDFTGAAEELVEEQPQSETRSPKRSKQPKAVQDRLAQEDAEIAELERKLGIKGRKSLPKSFTDDGLEDLLQDLDYGSGEALQKKKRKAEADEWLAQKRRKAEAIRQTNPRSAQPEVDTESGLDSDNDASELGLAGESSEEEGDDLDEGDNDSFGGFSSDEDEPSPPIPRRRENPYVPPTSEAPVVKYVPPSRRHTTGSEDESLVRLGRQIRGLTNRISDQNLIPFAREVEKLYRENPRQHVSTTLIDQLLNLVCNDTAVADKNFLLLAAFATAVYKVVGTDFGAHLVQELVERFQSDYDKARLPGADRSESRRPANLLSFLSGLYNFQLVGSNLPFDYIRLLLSDLTELNSELLLRITRLSGALLRQDDPSALKDIVTIIGAAVTRIGKDKISVRTMVMIDSINDLKNNKKANEGRDGAIEYTTQARKLLGSLNSRSLKATEPLRVGLSDILESDKKGKWWLVGASWAGRSSDDKKAGAISDGSDDESILLSGDNLDLPDLSELAREQMMNTDVRRSIFVAILSATDCEDAYVRLLKLRLNKERQREIPNVLMQCSGAEEQYNPYYTLIARRLCSDRKIRWAFQDCLWRLFGRLGESVFGEDVDTEDEEHAVELRRLVNTAKMMGTLISHGVLGLGILKCLNLPYLQAKTRSFVEMMLITALLDCYSEGQDSGQTAVAKVFMTAKDNSELVRGLQWFLRKVVRKSDLVRGKSNATTVKLGCSTAGAVLDKLMGNIEPEE
ncbi:hypothetical protein GQ53DRAFT_657049 [Thozetella sp. PMI_491]|nr:hypothetical protein GQ53DRAFT_657049 [Thozetella sp. PMI_491]